MEWDIRYYLYGFIYNFVEEIKQNLLSKINVISTTVQQKNKCPDFQVFC